MSKTKTDREKITGNDKPIDSKKSSGWNSAKKKKEPVKKDEADKSGVDKFFDTLSEQFLEQQAQIKSFRSKLTGWFTAVTVIQLVTINVLIFFIFFGDKYMLDAWLDFLKYLVGATFVELLGGLLIIVRFVFSRETFDMLKHLTYVDPQKEEKSKSE